MDAQTTDILIACNNEFYRTYAASFSDTRQSPWSGWSRCMEAANLADRDELSVLDVACGNFRFERFLADSLPDTRISAYAIDASEQLASGPPDNTKFEHLDILSSVRAYSTFVQDVQSPKSRFFDLSVCFGFMHHIPGVGLRDQVLDALIGATDLGGTICISFWNFERSEKMAKRARITTEEACSALGISRDTLDEGDRILGWNNTPGAWRYCHAFSDSEVDTIARTVSARCDIIDRFCADGRAGNLNDYLVVRRR